METESKLTKFDRQVIMEAYARCYGLREHVQDAPKGWAEQLAKETGYRASWLLKHAKEVREI